MTRKDFDLIASTLKSQKPPVEWEFDRWERIVNAFAQTLKDTNANFDKGRFIEACKK